MVTVIVVNKSLFKRSKEWLFSTKQQNYNYYTMNKIYKIT